MSPQEVCSHLWIEVPRNRYSGDECLVFVTREMCYCLDLGPDQRGSKVRYENSGPKYNNNSGDVKMVWFIFTREM